MDFRKMSSLDREESRFGSSASAQYDQGLRSYMISIYNYMAMALILTGVVAFALSSSPALMEQIFATPLKWVAMFAPLGIVLFLSVRVNKLSFSAAQGWFWAFAVANGVSLSTIFIVYTGDSISRTFFITAGAFASLSLYGYTTKKDLSAMGKFLFMGLIGIVIASIVNIFFESSALQFAVSIIGVFVFAGLTIYDTQRLKSLYYQLGNASEEAKKAAIMGALSLYLDFINLFVMLLQFLGNRE